jgi:DNA-binding NarL/FixJ family response regulator
MLADDHRIVREGVAKLLEPMTDVDLVGEASSGKELLELLESVDVDVVLLDVRMPEMSGLDVLIELKNRSIDTRVIVLSMHDDPSYVMRAIELGASGYLLKSVGKEELERALQVVSSGGSYIQGEITRPLIERMVHPAAGRSAAPLETKEIEILRLLADGLDNRDLAKRFDSTEPAIKAQLRTIYSKLDVKRRSEAVAVALRLGIID